MRMCVGSYVPVYGRLRHTHTIHTIHILYVCNVTVMEYALTIAKGVYMSSPSAATNIKQVNIYTKTQSFYLPMFVWEDEWEIKPLESSTKEKWYSVTGNLCWTNKSKKAHDLYLDKNSIPADDVTIPTNEKISSDDFILEMIKKL